MSFQVVALLAFQMIYGYLFYKIGIILTAFMVGLAAGGWSIMKAMPALKNERRAFLWIQVCLVVYPALLPVLFTWVNAAHGSVMRWIGANVVFIVMPALAGFVGGLQFPLAGRMLLGEDAATGRIGGFTYGIDLLGACAGALLTGAILIPVIGITQTCLAIAFMNTLILCILLLCNYESR